MTGTSDERRRRAIPRWLMLAIGIVVGFVAGMAIQYVRAERLDDRLEETERALALAQLESTLGAAAIEAQRGSYEVGRRLASDFFTGLQRSVREAPAELRDTLQGVLAQRDATITMLSRGDPESGNVLARLFAQYRGAVRDAFPPSGTAAGAAAGGDTGR